MIFRRFVLFLLFTALLLAGSAPSLVRAQSVELLFDKGGVFSGKKYVSIAHSDEDGTVPPDTAAVRAADRVYFAFRTTGDWSFGGDAEERLRKMTLVQEATTLSPEVVSVVGRDDPSTAVVGVAKSQIDWLTPVVFRHKVDTTEGLPLKEYYAPEYPPLERAYETGRRLLDDGEPLRAVEALRPFYGTVEPPFDLADQARAVLDTASRAALSQARSTFRSLRDDLISNPDAGGLARLDSFRVRLDSMQAVLGPYIDPRPEARSDVQTRFENLTTSADKLYANSWSAYRQNTLRIFMRGKYENPKLRLYLDVLTQMLLDYEAARAGKGLQVDSLRPSLLETPRFAEARRRLREQGRMQDFREVVALVNENISERQEVFGDEIMESLRLRRPAAPQPYYEIAAAMNALLADDRIRFSEAWNRALEKITELSLLNDLQRWRLASRRSPGAVPSRAWDLAEEARASQRKGAEGAAEDRFQLATRLAGEYAPFHYELGRIKEARGDTSAARTEYARARELAPSYVPPEARTLRILLDQEKYKQALARSDSVLKQQPYWLLYLPKARALVELRLHDKAIDVLRGRIEPLNDKSYALYAVLAKAYAEIGTWEGARWAVQQAEAFSPRRPVFKTLIAEVRARATEEGVSLEKTESDSVATDGQ